MNREIKFRVWNGMQMEHNIMAGFLGSFYVRGIDEDDTASMSNFNTKYSEETPLMQFTGLKDKNDVDIYEGDILTYGHSNKVKVTFENGCFSVFGEPLGWDFDSEEKPCLAYMGYCEVIGNIYDNAELIGGECT